ncbi:nitrate ABC transporter permease [Rhodoplanes elegans]|uniref:Nitrate ABC transporter permease n=1 Tax=Rhodoplanes elegans TaxID=29408 RepID=A0A327KP28_9BRAD|nr:ABC transporter permease subunit [Rhodoplanes elegans]MBK5958241.1 nitrate ABC transporter permease [Rhodoplanes elegans]RAI40177.1 nitrate ABC transporter permease [Rhodoplanes elegans]
MTIAEPRTRLQRAGLSGDQLAGYLRWAAPPAAGLVGLFALWWLGGLVIASNPRLVAFTGFAPAPALAAFGELITSGDAWKAAAPSLSRVLQGLAVAALIGIPVGIAIGLTPLLERAVQLPFQILRMVSPLAWMPVAVLAFPTWNGAIVFLITAASIWPIVFATAAGVKRIDPAWIAVGRTLGGRGFALVQVIVVRAVAPDILTGFRLALGVAWIVLVPAEFLGVTSGLGYAINDARDTLEYDRLAALVLLIGLIGFALDALAAALLDRARWTPTA